MLAVVPSFAALAIVPIIVSTSLVAAPASVIVATSASAVATVVTASMLEAALVWACRIVFVVVVVSVSPLTTLLWALGVVVLTIVVVIVVVILVIYTWLVRASLLLAVRRNVDFDEMIVDFLLKAQRKNEKIFKDILKYFKQILRICVIREP